MTVTPTELPEVLLLEVQVFRDERGWFQEIWNPERVVWDGLPSHFVQDNLAFSRQGVLRGLHFQDPHPQGKLVMVIAGEIFDVAVDVRVESPTFGRWVSRRLKGESGTALYIPPGFAHGYQVLSEQAHVLYKCTDSYHPESERAVAWNDPDLAIDWPIQDPIVAAKDQRAPALAQLRTR